uniref:Diacylglycerol O-acyltransferase 3, cytosolic n=1 Tax=Ananas comosus var. bracteatus TaxID=296719 RepID=A0A6V7PDE0_ANACO|nr:unnamed protein product [Ananas comosus var. bracteatus]
MEISGAVVIRRSPIVSGAGVRRGLTDPSLFSGRTVAGSGRRLRVPARRPSGSSGGFFDEGHLKYYVSPARCGERKKEEKKRAKLVKGLRKDLAALHSMGFGVGIEEAVAGAGEVKSKMISEAAELLLTQLNQMRAQEKEMKKKRKEEKKAAMKSTKMKGCADDDDSSCSSSESSDSECEETVRMSTCKTASAIVPHPQSEVTVVPTVNSLCNAQPQTKPITSKHALECCGESNVAVEKPIDSKIEVCMGGKCKRSGALELMKEFEREVGIDGAVVGCKCMGKCKDGPNVRVLNHNAEVGSLKVSKNPLCIGVGLEDVGTIVANFFSEKDVGLMTA